MKDVRDANQPYFERVRQALSTFTMDIIALEIEYQREMIVLDRNRHSSLSSVVSSEFTDR